MQSTGSKRSRSTPISLIGQWVVLAIAIAPAIAACNADKPSETESTRTRSRALTSSVSMTMRIPRALNPRNVNVGAFQELRINDRSTVKGLTIGTGEVPTNVGVDAKIDSDLWSVPDVALRDRAQVTGDAFSQGIVSKAAGAVVLGMTTQSMSFGPLVSRSLTVAFDSSASDKIVPPDANLDAEPGAYGNVSLGARSVLRLSSGFYRIASLSLEPQATILLDQSKGSVVVISQGSATFRGKISTADPGARPQFLLVVAGQQTVVVSAPFHGAIFAPNAKIELASVGAPGHVGQFIGRQVEIHQGQTVGYAPYDSWGELWDRTGPGTSGGTVDAGLERLFRDTPAGAALVHLHDAANTQTDEHVLFAAQQAVQALPPLEVATELELAAELASGAGEVWSLVFLSAALERPEIVPFLKSFLEEPVPPEYLSDDLDVHDADPGDQLAVLHRSISVLSHLVSLGISEAREPLLSALSHPVAAVRGFCVFRINLLGATDPIILAEMHARLSPSDAAFLDLREAQPADFAVPVPSGLEEETSAESADLGRSEESTVSLPVPSCSDQLLNEAESDIDCGGSCPRCGPNQSCNLSSDCVAGHGCTGGVCQPKGGGPCTWAIATELGSPGTNATVPNNACLRVMSAYPSWWGTRNMQLQTTTPGTYPAPFAWQNPCAGGSGQGQFSADWQNQIVGPTNQGCPTLIKLNGDGSGTVTIRYYAN